MKRTILFFVLLISIFTKVAAEESLFSFSVGPQSGIVFYGDNEIKSGIKELDGSHILAGAIAELNLNPFKQVSFFISANVLTDIVKDHSYHSNHIHIDFPFGIKIYPGLAGLCTGLSYTFGFRSDTIQLPEQEPVRQHTPTGNGFSVILEYNFAHLGKYRYLPTLGACWKHIPRGNNTTDNIISAYVLINL